MKTEDQLANILKKSLGKVKFAELSERIGAKKPLCKNWSEEDMKKLKEENVGAEYSSSGMAGASGEVVGCRGKHPSSPAGAHSAGTVAPPNLVPRGTQQRMP